MKKIIFLIFLIILFLYLFDLYNPFGIKIINLFENNNTTYIKKDVVVKKEKKKQHKLSPQEYFSIGEKHLENNKFEKAITNFSKAIELEPNYIEAYKGRSLAKDRIRDYVGSKEDYEQYLILLNKKNKEEYEEIKPELNNLVDNVRKKIINKKYNDALTESKNIIDTYPKYPNGYIIRADTYFSMQQYKQALNDYKKALSVSLEDKNFTLYLKIANTEYELELYKEAINDYSYLTSLNSNYDYAYYKLTGAYILIENFNKALNSLEKYIKTSKTKKIQIKDFSKWMTVLNKYTENETIRDLKKDLKELNFVQS